jgi:hypothetical protein
MKDIFTHCFKQWAGLGKRGIGTPDNKGEGAALRAGDAARDGRINHAEAARFGRIGNLSR